MTHVKFRKAWVAALFIGSLGAGTVVMHPQQCKNFVVTTSMYADKVVHISKMHTVHSKYTLHKWKMWLENWKKQHPGKVFHPHKHQHSNTENHVVLTPCLPMFPEEGGATSLIENLSSGETLGITPMNYSVTKVGTPEASAIAFTSAGSDTENEAGGLYGGGSGGGIGGVGGVGVGEVGSPVVLPITYPNTPTAVTPEPESFTLMMIGAMLITLAVVKKEIQ